MPTKTRTKYQNTVEVRTQKHTKSFECLATTVVIQNMIDTYKLCYRAHIRHLLIKTIYKLEPIGKYTIQ